MVGHKSGKSGKLRQNIWKEKSNPPKKSVGRIREIRSQKPKTAKITVSSSVRARFGNIHEKKQKSQTFMST